MRHEHSYSAIYQEPCMQSTEGIENMDIAEEDSSNVFEESATCRPIIEDQVEVVEELQLQHGQISTTDSFKLEGRRIVDVGFFIEEIVNSGYHKPFNCSIIDMEVISEHRNGFSSDFIFKCKMCGVTKVVNTNPKNSTNVNDTVVMAATSIGIGYSQVEELFSALNIPVMAKKTYSASHENIQHIICNSALESMKVAAKEEAEIAKNLGNVDRNGIPCITVVVDGAWSKRSYNVNYNALSGVACIVGQKTGKLLYLGIRNKYCCICAKGEKTNMTPKEHCCYKNWEGPSTTMESNIIVEGFKNSISMHNIKYTRLIGNGDSSVYKKLVGTKPYGSLAIEKIECRNHLYRNFFSKLREISNRRKSNSKNAVVPIPLRKHILNCSQRITIYIKKATEYRSKQNIDLAQKIELLKRDILNCPSHIFGEHEQCENIKYFKCTPKIEINYVPEMKACGVYDDIKTCLYRLIYNASSLLHNMSTNDAEHYNSVLCKFVGGKRINFSQRDAYTVRCNAAALSFNEKNNYYNIIHYGMTKNYPNAFLHKYIQRRKRSAQMRQKKIKKFTSKKNIQCSDTNYGAVSTYEPDLEPEVYAMKKQELLLNLRKSITEIQNIERETRGQSSNPIWFQYKSNLLTAWNFGSICKLRSTTSRAKVVENLLYKRFTGNTATKYGIDSEPLAIAEFKSKLNVSVESCGIFIDETYGFFGASPDGLVGSDAIVEVKCPYKCKNLSVHEAIATKIITFATLNENKMMQLKNNHNYYYQIQGQLNITKRNVCYFVVWSPKGMLVEKIYRDTNFWDMKMKNVLTEFYFSYLLPEIIDPRKPRNLEIRNSPL